MIDEVTEQFVKVCFGTCDLEKFLNQLRPMGNLSQLQGGLEFVARKIEAGKLVRQNKEIVAEIELYNAASPLIRSNGLDLDRTMDQLNKALPFKLRLKVNDRNSAAQNLLKAADDGGLRRQILEFLENNDYSDIPGYVALAKDMKSNSIKKINSILQALRWGKILKDEGRNIFFENKMFVGVDIDLGDYLPNGSINEAIQLKTISGEKIVMRAREAVKQLAKLSPSEAKSKTVIIESTAVTWDDLLRVPQKIESIETIKRDFPDVKLIVFFADDVMQVW
ncbi:MAG: hypothetical protein HRU19_15330 [Pseudobacteriovorax sp.]|nr:hypothetical protein [Pseudobacteriovorax sp.]